MGYILMQPDDSNAARDATQKLLETGECDSELAHSSACLRPILFDSRSCTATEWHYHGFVGEIVCG